MKIGGEYLASELVATSREQLAKKAKVDQTTLWRWLEGVSLPNYSNILDVAGNLDVDPVVLFDLDPEGFPDLIKTLLKGFQGSRGKLPRWISKLLPLNTIAGFPHWPNFVIPDHTWQNVFVEHDPKKTGITNHFARLSISPTSQCLEKPQVWHFAYRDVIPVTTGWKPYGFVVLFRDTLSLYHYSGMTQRISASAKKPIVVETWFGLGRAEFLISSLHKYQLVQEDFKKPSSHLAVRFSFPGQV